MARSKSFFDLFGLNAVLLLTSACGVGASTTAAADPQPSGSQPQAGHATAVNALPAVVGEVTRLGSIWDSWKTETRTLKVAGHRFTGLCTTSDTAMTRRQALALIHDQIIPLIREAAPTTLQLASLTDAEFPHNWAIYKSHGRFGSWKDFTFVDTSAGTRVDESAADYFVTRIRKDGKEQEFASPTKQASLFPAATNMYMERISDFLNCPPIATIPGLRLVKTSNSIYRLTNDRFILDYEPATGFVKNDTRKLTAESFLFEVIQDLPQRVSNRVRIPKFAARITYHMSMDVGEPRVRSLQLHVNNSMIVNEQAPPDVLALKVPAGATIVDFGKQRPSKNPGESAKPLAQKVTVPVDDAVVYSKSQRFTEPLVERRAAFSHDYGHSGWRQTMFWLNAAALVALTVWWYFRRRARRQI